MAHTYTSLFVHCVFSTKERRNLLSKDVRERLWPYLGGIAREKGMSAVAVGGTDNHVHILLSVPPTISAAKAVQLIKGTSSKWIHDTFPTHASFAWQEGYGAFTINVSGIEETIAYINRQEEHHRVRSFEEEYIGFLKRHRIEYDDRYVGG
jgi:putative transposase